MGIPWAQMGTIRSICCRVLPTSATGLNEFIRRYETLHLRATHTSETDEKVTSRFQFRAHGRYMLTVSSVVTNSALES